VTIRRHNERTKLVGHWEAEPVRDAESLSRYLVKTLLPENKRYRVKGRAITYSESIQRPPWWLAREGST
jgi:hypothetical protein